MNEAVAYKNQCPCSRTMSASHEILDGTVHPGRGPRQKESQGRGRNQRGKTITETSGLKKVPATKSGQDAGLSIFGGWHLFPFDSE
jgi:hypothetical protein